MLSVKAGARRYDNSRRAEQAAATRRAVLDATRRIVIDSGYSGVTMRTVAREAAVSVRTVYRTFGSRQELVRRALDPVRGYQPEAPHDDPSVPAVERPRSGTEILAQVARDARLTFEGLGPASAMLLVAARTGEAELRDLAAEAGALRMAGTTRVARAVAADLRNGIDEIRAADILWVLTSPEITLQLTTDCGWSADDYEHWLATILIRALLPASRRAEG